MNRHIFRTHDLGRCKMVEDCLSHKLTYQGIRRALYKEITFLLLDWQGLMFQGFKIFIKLMRKSLPLQRIQSICIGMHAENKRHQQQQNDIGHTHTHG